MNTISGIEQIDRCRRRLLVVIATKGIVFAGAPYLLPSRATAKQAGDVVRTFRIDAPQ